VASATRKVSVLYRAVLPSPSHWDSLLPKRRHHLLGKAPELRLKLCGAGPKGKAKHNVLEAGRLLFKLLQIRYGLVRGATEPRFFGQDIFVIDTSGDMAGDTRGTKLLHLLLTIAQHPQGGSKFTCSSKNGLRARLACSCVSAT